MRKKRWLALCLGALLALGCSKPVTNPEPPPVVQEPPAVEPPAPPPPPPPVRARILAVGDLLMHLPLVSQAAQADGGWNFEPLFEPVRPWISEADLAIANLETTLTGTEYPWSGYPSFNTPPEFARDLKAVGFDVITHANNHSLDYGEFGLKQTSEALERYGLPHTGTARTQEEREQILVVEVAEGIRMAVLAYTYGTNGVPLPHPWSVNMLDADLIQSDVRRARAMDDVDLVAVALHFGEEYQREPNEEQQRFVELTLNAGADIILGDHPHVIQRIEWRQVKDEHGRDLPRAVIFSEGNFVHNQSGLHREEGLMLLVDVKKENGVTAVEGLSFVPTWVHKYQVNGQNRYRVVVVEKAIKDYEAKTDPLITDADYLRLKEIWADVTQHAVGSPEVAVWHAEQPHNPY